MRAPTTDDVDAIVELVAAAHAADGRQWAYDRDEVAEMFDDPHDDPAHDQRVVDATDPDHASGRLVAWVQVSHAPSGTRLERAWVEGAVHPDHRRRGHGSRLMAWADRRADERLATTDHRLPASALVDRYDGEDGHAALFAQHGYRDVRHFEELQRPLADLPPAPVPDGITLRPWAVEHAEPTRHVHNEAFADHWGSPHRDERSWRERILGGAATRLDLSAVAVAGGDVTGGDVVGYCLASHYPQDAATTGRRDGWVHLLGTRRSHRGRGVATALVLHVLHGFVEAGLDSAMLGVDRDSQTRANDLYAGLGFRVLHRSTTSERVVRTA